MEQVIERLGARTAMEKACIDAPEDVLVHSSRDLQRTLAIKEPDARALLNAAAQDAYAWRQRRRDGTEKPTQYLVTGDNTIDRVLGGGIPLGTLTEVVGESASGKTQLCLQLCLTVQNAKQRDGLGGASIYLHSEGRFQSTRLDQLAQAYCSQHAMDATAAKRAIHTMQIRDSEEQFRALAYRVPAFLEKNKQVRLIVIDSVGASYRGDTGHSTDSKLRFDKMAEICTLGMRLKKLAHTYNVAVVAVNQVADVPQADQAVENPRMEAWMDFQLPGVSLGLFIHSLLKKPILGLAWSNAVTTRIRLARSPWFDGQPTRRILFVEFSPLVARGGCEIMIDKDGLHAVR